MAVRLCRHLPDNYVDLTDYVNWLDLNVYKVTFHWIIKSVRGLGLRIGISLITQKC